MMKDLKQAYEQGARNYGNALANEIRAKVEAAGGEYNLPSVEGEDTIVLGDPAKDMTPKTVYVTSKQSQLRLEAYEPESDETYDVEVCYPVLPIETLEAVLDLLDRPLDDDSEWDD